MSQQSLRQASIRAVTSTTYTYEGDWHALWDLLGIAAGQFNERMLVYINQQLSTSYTEINGAMAAFAAEHGSTTFQAIGTFTPGFSLDAPVLTLLTDETDNTPLWGFDLTDPEEGDVIRLEWDDAIPYVAQVSFADYTLTEGDLSGDFEFDFGLSAFADGPWSWRAYHRRGASSSAVSNEVSETISTTSKLLLVNGTDHLLLVNGTDKLLLAA